MVAAIEPGSVPASPLVAHGGEQAADVLELGGRVVEGDHPGALAERLEGVPSGAAAHVEQQVARLHAEPVEPDGEHYLRFQLQADAVLLDGLHGRVLPRPVVDDALAAAGADGGRAGRARRGAQRSLAASASLLPGSTSIAVSPSLPTTSGMAPPVVATTGVPHDMASMAGSEKPS